MSPEQKARALKRFGGGRRPRTAFHEAGHVLACIHFGHFFYQAIVRSVQEVLDGPHLTERGQKVDAEGIVEGYDLCSPYRATPEELRADGREAALRNGFMSAEVKMVFCIAGPMAEARFRHCSLAAVMMTAGDEDWREAKACAETWFRLDPGAALGAAEKRARALVLSQAGWRAIERMAAVLMDRGILGCEEANDVFAAAYGAPAPALKAWAGRWPPSLASLRAGRLPSFFETREDSPCGFHAAHPRSSNSRPTGP